MLCHKAGDLPPDRAHDVVCQGWVRVMGMEAIGVRIAAMRGAVTADELEDGNRPDLFDSFDEMLEANGVEPPARNRWTAPSG
jgi:hypothetical protein